MPRRKAPEDLSVEKLRRQFADRVVFSTSLLAQSQPDRALVEVREKAMSILQVLS